MLMSYLHGMDLEEVLPTLSENTKYQLGRKAGEILRKIHSLPVDKKDLASKSKKEKKATQLNLNVN